MSTAEIDSVEQVNAHFRTVYTAKIAGLQPHPNADALSLVDVDTGNKKYRVVCGARNHKKGDIVALAMVGTRLGENMLINKAKIRGQESEGMLCSERELGISDDHSGIMILPPETRVGIPLSELFPHRVDVRFEIDNKSITHRPDLWSHEGFAREISALYNRPFTSVVDMSLVDELKADSKLSVKILSPEAAPRYSGLAVAGVVIRESPDWLKAMLQSIGMRPINNIVDITNYVMAELGEPMHAFDQEKLSGPEILVRMARENEHLTTLDGQVFSLFPEDIVIADSKGAIALAGVMGGGNSEIDDSTTEIVLEAANFNPVNIRKTANRYSHRTEAAIRFEKSLSPELTVPALLRSYELIKRIIPGAHAVTKIIDAYPKKQNTIVISTDADFIRKRLGQDIDDNRIREILSGLDFKIRSKGKSLSIEVPRYRATKDISIPEDIVEEVGRIYGYGNIVPKAPRVSCETPPRNQFRLFERKIKSILSGNHNMIEVSGYSFTGEETLNKLKINEDAELRLRNPLSSEQDRLRRSLLPDIVNVLKLNARYGDEFLIYELGRVYIKNDRTSPELAQEKTMVTGAVYRKKPDDLLFYDIKKIVSGIMAKLRVADYALIPEGKKLPPYAHPARSMALLVESAPAGYLFELHPETAREFDITGAAALFDICVNSLFEAKKRDQGFIELQKYPEVPFEVSVIADQTVYSRDICSIIEQSNSELIQGVDVVSVYAGPPIPEGKKSVSLKVTFASRDRTLTPDEIEKLQKNIITLLIKSGFQLR
ncbi:MAG: phenylalanine--tRNA ligase subunit beta [Spirochaetes bacterium RBG_16_49_21]|nr:MAG: phenylalanine--tRNA ligase subunit beta [Spirochaetes bacterium RBG_16_49_21]